MLGYRFQVVSFDLILMSTRRETSVLMFIVEVRELHLFW